jgi:hypothetical protein
VLKLEGLVAGAFQALGVAAVYSQASSKKTAYLRACAPLLKKPLKSSKALSVAVARDLILPNHPEPAAASLLHAIRTQEKKDDYADALVHACAWASWSPAEFVPILQRPAAEPPRHIGQPAGPSSAPGPLPHSQRARKVVVIDLVSSASADEDTADEHSSAGSSVMLD